METPLKAVRLSRSLSQRTVAAAVGLKQAQYCRIEKDGSASSDAAERIARFFGHAVTEMQILYPERYLEKAG